LNYQKIGKEWSQASITEINVSMELFEVTKALIADYTHTWKSLTMLTLDRLSLSRILYYDDLYKKILSVPGVICEFGVRYGTSLSLFQSFRGIYEPYNHTRKIIGFDTFEGFLEVDQKDGEFSKKGDYSVDPDYLKTLQKILSLQEKLSPVSHITKFSLIKGDASYTVPTWMDENPHALISMAIFDMDVYRPTKDVLQAILPRLTKGSLLVFDELNSEKFPGEVRAVNEVLGINNLRLHCNSNQPPCAWAIFGE
jgi:hypothetical protein